ncbi:putative ABC transporter ATP-binding protein YfiL [Luteitalea sp. TBR-22]|uniref:ABC transporter ATP-binding protein n=1 Tax=Luteitalea sp. TBR-22 TaxID=2802971 RepID=UPI001AFC9D9F|nr:ABC transporter ATP-binding protein [Luteitalea sp. TBR-22]BCS31182.1 putative ABC transporter ATP-binding protein YfiL [Luteitalea sp. TBR-22]
MLVLSHIVKRYGDRVAVDDLSLEVRPGEILGLLGPNGAGKSTTMHVATGLLAPDAGQVAIGTHGTPSAPAARRRLGLAPQNLAVYDLLSAEENLQFFGKLYGLTGQALRTRVDAALAFVGLTERRRDLVGGYSGGMKRRLNIAAAVLHEPDLVLLDEPTVGVDPQSRNAIFDSIEALRAQGRTLVYSTHYMEEAVRLCDRIAIMDAGRMRALDTVAGLLRTYGGPPRLHARVAGRDVVIETRDPLTELNRLSSEGQLESFRVEEPTLEQVFLSLTGHTLRD